MSNNFLSECTVFNRKTKTLFTLSELLFLKKKSFEYVPKTRFYQIQLETIFVGFIFEFLQQFSQSTDCYRLLTASEQNFTLTYKEINKPKIEISMATQSLV